MVSDPSRATGDDTVALPYAGLRLLAVHAHPDDEASKGAATTAMYAALGAEVIVATCTGGERGDVLNDSFVAPAGMRFDSVESKREVRRLEMAAAAAALGVQQTFLGWTDSGYSEPRKDIDLAEVYPETCELGGGIAAGYTQSGGVEGDAAQVAFEAANSAGLADPAPVVSLADVWDPRLPDDAFAMVPLEVAAAPLVELVRRFRPHVITTYDHFGGYPHPDHVYTHSVTWEAWRTAGDPTKHVVDGGAEPWTPLKMYYNHGFSTARLRAVHEAMVARGLESPFAEWLADREQRQAEGQDSAEREVTALIRSVNCFPARDAALRAHTSQIDPDGFFFAVPRDLEAEVWPWDEYELAATNGITVAQTPETDLFAGVPRR